jgi:hypothetical protein
MYRKLHLASYDMAVTIWPLRYGQLRYGQLRYGRNDMANSDMANYDVAATIWPSLCDEI